MALGDYLSIQCHACIGGTSIGEDIRKLDYGQHMVSGTPGRVFDMIQRRNLRTRSIKMFILDESDEMLNQGFKEQIYDVYRYLPPGTQVVLLSATLPVEILQMTTKFMTDPIRILVKRDELTLEGIKQFFVAVEREEWKFDTLCDLYVVPRCESAACRVLGHGPHVARSRLRLPSCVCVFVCVCVCGAAAVVVVVVVVVVERGRERGGGTPQQLPFVCAAVAADGAPQRVALTTNSILVCQRQVRHTHHHTSSHLLQHEEKGMPSPAAHLREHLNPRPCTL